MDAHHYAQEAKKQSILWNKLKRWLQYAMILSSLLVALIYGIMQSAFPYQIPLCILFILALMINVAVMLIIARSLKHGKQNIENLLECAEKAAQ